MNYVDIRLECFWKKVINGGVLFCVNVYECEKFSRNISVNVNPDIVDCSKYDLVGALLSLLVIKNYVELKNVLLRVEVCGLERKKIRGLLNGHTSEYVDQYVISNCINIGNLLYERGVVVKFDWSFKKTNGVKSIDTLRSFENQCTNYSLVRELKVVIEDTLRDQIKLDDLYRKIRGEGLVDLRRMACRECGLSMSNMRIGDVYADRNNEKLN